MKIANGFKQIIVVAGILGLAACSSTRHGTGSPISEGGAGGEGGAYAQGLGGSGGAGFSPSASCNVPQLAGYNTQAYYFDFNSNDVHSEDLNRLQSLGQSLAARHTTVRVVGNTDSRGSREYNAALGWRRANAVATTLEQYGISKQQVTTDSNGSEKPIAFGSSEDDFQCNRRVDVSARG